MKAGIATLSSITQFPSKVRSCRNDRELEIGFTEQYASDAPDVFFFAKKPWHGYFPIERQRVQSVYRGIYTSPNSKKFGEYLAKIATGGGAFDADSFRNKPHDQQRGATDGASPRLENGQIGTSRIVIDLARKGRLGFVSRGDHQWMFQVTSIFELPVQFDMDIPTKDGEMLVIRGFRSIRREIGIAIWDGSQMPNAIPQPAFQMLAGDNVAPDSSKPGANTAAIFRKVLNYFRLHHSWLNYGGHDPNGWLKVLLNIGYSPINDNAAWTFGDQRIIIGAGGTLLSNQKDSISILGHEFTHAIVEHSSGLVYEGQSGGLNEHFADIEGSYMEE